MSQATMAPMPRTPKRNDKTVRIDADVAHTAGIVAAYKGLNLNEYLSDTLRPIVEKQLAEEQDRAAKARKGGGK
jgi:predicted HicB family RNase H-like nuclease